MRARLRDPPAHKVIVFPPEVADLTDNEPLAHGLFRPLILFNL